MILSASGMRRIARAIGRGWRPGLGLGIGDFLRLTIGERRELRTWRTTR